MQITKILDVSYKISRETYYQGYNYNTINLIIQFYTAIFKIDIIKILTYIIFQFIKILNKNLLSKILNINFKSTTVLN